VADVFYIVDRAGEDPVPDRQEEIRRALLASSDIVPVAPREGGDPLRLPRQPGPPRTRAPPYSAPRGWEMVLHLGDVCSPASRGVRRPGDPAARGFGNNDRPRRLQDANAGLPQGPHIET